MENMKKLLKTSVLSMVVAIGLSMASLSVYGQSMISAISDLTKPPSLECSGTYMEKAFQYSFKIFFISRVDLPKTLKEIVNYSASVSPYSNDVNFNIRVGDLIGSEFVLNNGTSAVGYDLKQDDFNKLQNGERLKINSFSTTNQSIRCSFSVYIKIGINGRLIVEIE